MSAAPQTPAPLRYAIWAGLLLLAIVHQDFWLWDSTELLFGWLPVSLGFHIGLSLTAAALWMLAILFCWPLEDEESDQAGEQP